MEKELFRKLIDKYLQGKASLQEEELLLKHYDALQRKECTWNEEELGNQNEVHSLIFSRIENEIEREERKSSKRIWNWAFVAASTILLCIGGFFFSKNQTTPSANNAAVIKPGSNDAILTLADGSKIRLNAVANGEIAKQNGMKITKAADGQLVYTVSNSTINSEREPAFNTVETPRGGQYQINLPDGSKVWLNAASSLKYPTAFKGNERKVELTGEGYFEIAKDKAHPFKVITQNQKVEVLGTHFNIDAYNDNGNTKTTLLEGSVKACLINTNDSRILKPGEQMTVNQQKISVIEVDTEEVIAWKNGYFMFNDESLETIMNKIGRWYNVDVEYSGNTLNKKFGGSISRFKDVKDVLNMLELTGSVHFKIEGRRVVVMP